MWSFANKSLLRLVARDTARPPTNSNPVTSTGRGWTVASDDRDVRGGVVIRRLARRQAGAAGIPRGSARSPIRTHPGFASGEDETGGRALDLDARDVAELPSVTCRIADDIGDAGA